MNQFKRAQVIMLPTEQYTNLCLGHNLSYVESKNSISIDAIWKSIKLQYPYKPQHLYIISDDKIEEGDLHIESDHSGFGFRKYKIIATTDTSLFRLEDCPVRGGDSNVKYTLPQPSQQFIEKYIEEYNKGNIITDVLVEYETLKTTANNKHFGEGHVYSITNKLKINPKDNTITIKKLKDSWNREEVIELLNQCYNLGYNSKKSEIPDLEEMLELDNWIEENL